MGIDISRRAVQRLAEHARLNRLHAACREPSIEKKAKKGPLNTRRNITKDSAAGINDRRGLVRRKTNCKPSKKSSVQVIAKGR